jgi:hypothetical protein
MNYNKELILCECGSMEHQIVFIWFDDNEDNEVFAQIHLNTEKSFYERLVSGIKYIFGYKSKYGNFDEIILSSTHIEGLKKVIKKLEEE